MFTKIDEFSVLIRVKKENYDSDYFEWYKVANKIIDEIVDLLDIERYIGKKDDSSAGLQSYNVSFKYGQEAPVYVGYHNMLPIQGLLFRFTSSSLEYIEEPNYKVIQKIFDYVSNIEYLECHLTRVDLAIDFIDSSYNLNAIAKNLESGKYEVRGNNNRLNKSTKKIIVNPESGCETIYLGSRKSGSPAMLRIYDKKAEQVQTGGKYYSYALSIESWLRFEAEFHKEYSKQIGEKIRLISSDEEYHNLICQMFCERYNFIVQKTGNYTKFTEEMRKGIDTKYGELFSENREIDNLAKKKEYFILGDSGLQSLLYLIREGQGEEELYKFIEDVVSYQINDYEPSEKNKRIAEEIKERKKYKKK